MKTKMKIFLVSVIGIIAIICQECVRRHFGINPQIWVFVVYAMVMAGFYLIICTFNKELDETQILERMERSKFVRWCTEEYSVKEEKSRFKRLIKKVLESRIYKRINSLTGIFICCVLIYSFFFFDIFWLSKFIGIVCLLLAMEFFTYLIVVEKKQRKLFYGVQMLMQLLIAAENMLLS